MRISLENQLRKMSPFIRVAPFYFVLACLVAMYIFIVSLSLTRHDEVSAQATQAKSIQPVTAHQQTTKVTTIIGTPLRFEVPKLSMNLVVDNGVYDNNTDSWSLSKTAVQYAVVTTKPNNIRGNTIIYGHNTQAVLAPLKDIAVGDMVKITTTNGHTFTYIYSHDKIVDPSFTEVFNENPNKPQLTVLTCEGTWSKVRRLMYFDFKSVT